MLEISIAAVPNQTLSVRLGDNQYDIALKATNGIMAVDITRNNIPVLQGQRAVANFPLIPYFYKESGNFVIISENGDIPEYSQFGVTQFLIFASEEELAALRAGT